MIKSGLIHGVDGEFYIVLNNIENTVPFTDKQGNVILNTQGKKTIRDFTYIKIKDSGKKIDTRDEVQQKLLHWIIPNIPREALDKLGITNV
jgi:hypothetical protein